MSQIVNCIRCNRLFRQSRSGKCPECSVRENEQFSQMFQLLQRSKATGGVHIREVSRQISMPENIIEEYFLEGKLGTAAPLLQFSCKKCGHDYSGKEGHSTICYGCRSTVSEEAGVTIKGRNEVLSEQGDLKRMEMVAKMNGTAHADTGPKEMRAKSDFSRNI